MSYFGKERVYYSQDTSAGGGKDNSSFVSRLYQEGTLDFTDETIQQIATPVLDTIAARAKELKATEMKPRARKLAEAELGSEMQTVQLFYLLAPFFEGRIPAVWKDPQVILRTLETAQNEGVQLPEDLKRFGIVHPEIKVRTATCEKQQLTNEQLAIAGYCGIASADPKLNEKTRKLAEIAMIYVPFEFYNILESEFGFFTRAQKQTEKEDKLKPTESSQERSTRRETPL